jgi:hypothetical protein
MFISPDVPPGAAVLTAEALGPTATTQAASNMANVRRPVEWTTIDLLASAPMTAPGAARGAVAATS